MIIFTQVSGKLQDIDLTALESAGQKIQSDIASSIRGNQDLNRIFSLQDFIQQDHLRFPVTGRMMFFQHSKSRMITGRYGK